LSHVGDIGLLITRGRKITGGWYFVKLFFVALIGLIN